ncbi:hypothetical protein GP486_006300, partial [Trichoglossum hirsutum]
MSTQMPSDGERKGDWPSTKPGGVSSPTGANSESTPTHCSRGLSHSALDGGSLAGKIFSSTSSGIDVPIFGEDGNTPQAHICPDPFLFDYSTDSTTSHLGALGGSVPDLLGIAVPGSHTAILTPVLTPGDGGNRGESGRLGDVEDVDAFMQIDFRSTPMPLPTNASAAHGDQIRFGQAHHKTLDERELCVQRLLELNSSLLQDLSRINSGKLADTLALSGPSRSNNPSNSSNSNVNNEPLHPHNAIGRILTNSEQFLNILKYFAPSSSTGDRSSSVCSYSSEFEDAGEEPQVAGQGDHFQRGDMMDSGPHASIDALGDDDARAPMESPRPDVPATLAILACYTYIVKIYSAIFLQVHESLLRSHRSPLLYAAIPSTLSGLQLGGYDLDSRGDLQIEILIHVSFR